MNERGWKQDRAVGVKLFYIYEGFVRFVLLIKFLYILHHPPSAFIPSEQVSYNFLLFFLLSLLSFSAKQLQFLNAVTAFIYLLVDIYTYNITHIKNY